MMRQSGAGHGPWTPVLAALLLGLAAASPASADPAPTFQSVRPTQRVEYWQQREMDIAAQLSRGTELPSIKLVFVGDSITDFWQLGADPWVKGQFHGRPVWDETFGAGATPDNRALNLGVSGDRTEHILYRLAPKSAGGLGELDDPALRPDYVILMAGINNTWAQEAQPVDAIVEGVTAIVLAIHARKPNARIVIQSLLPTNDDAKNRDIVQPVNARLAALSANPAFADYAVFLDLYPGFVDPSGKQVAALFNEGLHPSEAGYKVWRDRLAPFLDRDRGRQTGVPANGAEIGQAMVRFYPLRAQRAGVTGRVEIACNINSLNYLDHCTTRDETPPNWGFADAALTVSKIIRLRARPGGAPFPPGSQFHTRIRFQIAQ